MERPRSSSPPLLATTHDAEEKEKGTGGSSVSATLSHSSSRCCFYLSVYLSRRARMPATLRVWQPHAALTAYAVASVRPALQPASRGRKQNCYPWPGMLYSR
eukprot:380328-Rhodomonas_salina.2